jgi:hypothetical protein
MQTKDYLIILTKDYAIKIRSTEAIRHGHPSPVPGEGSGIGADSRRG